MVGSRVRIQYRDNQAVPFKGWGVGDVLYTDERVILIRRVGAAPTHLLCSTRTGEDDRAQLWRIHPDDLATLPDGGSNP